MSNNNVTTIKRQDSLLVNALGFLFFVGALIALAVAPAIVIGVWKWALG